MWLRLSQFVVTLTLTTATAASIASPRAPSIPASWSACFRQAGQFYSLSPQLLAAIARTESGFNPRAVNVNPNGSRDVGLMQINSRWFPALTRTGIPPERLYEPCVSIWVGAWLLADVIADHGYSWDAVGAYNAGSRNTPASAQRRAAYALRVARSLAVESGRVGLLDADGRGRSGIAEYAVADPAADDAAADQPQQP